MLDIQLHLLETYDTIIIHKKGRERTEYEMKKVTIQDVARELNLSRNTVAKALNNSDTVAYETRYLVVEKAAEMGYTKLDPAVLEQFRQRGGTIGETKTIVVLTRRELSIFWNRIIMGISDELNKRSYTLQLNFISDQEEQTLSLPLDFKEKVDGILILSVFSKPYVDKIRAKGIPMVFLDMPGLESSFMEYGDVLFCEGRNSTKKIVQHLVRQGIRKIGFLGDTTYCLTIRERYEGYLAGLKEAGIEPDESMIVNKHMPKRYYTPEEVAQAMGRMKELPEAIVCANDDIALDVIRYLKARGYRVPEDVAVTGYDNVEEMAQVVEPFLTTVRVGNQRLGKRLVKQLLTRIENPDFPNEMTAIGVEVIFRNSTRKIKDLIE